MLRYLRDISKEELKFAFMSVDIGKVSAEGIRYKNIRYTCTKKYKSIGLKKLEIMENPAF